MFLSVIVSCFNCRETIKRVLNSLIIQSFQDFEVIISDDCSEDDFMEVVDKYKDLLTIRYFKTTNPIHCPGNTRRTGLENATGEWVTFIDHDDAFTNNAFQVFVDTYNNAETKLPFFFSPAAHISKDGSSSTLTAQTWLHGNFYNRQWLLDNQINFKENLLGNEDLYFNNLVYDTLSATDTQYWTCSTPLYNWYIEENSFSNKPVENGSYTEKFFTDYITACLEPRIILAQKYPEKFTAFRTEAQSTFLYAYFYYERALYLYKDAPVVQDMLIGTKRGLKQFFEIFSGDTQELYNNFFTDNKTYNDFRNIVMQCSGQFVETHSLRKFLELVWQQ